MSRITEDVDKYLEELDLNKDGVSDKKQVKDYFINIWKWIKTHKVTVILAVCLAISLFALAKLALNQPTTQPTLTKIKSAISQTVGNSQDEVVYNLSKMEVTKRVLTTSSKSGKEIFGVWYKSETPMADVHNSTYLTRFENIDNLKYNKKEFDKYVEEETKNAALLSKPVKK